MSDTLRPPSLTPPTAGGSSDTLRTSSLTQPAARRTGDTWRPPSLTTPQNVRALDTRQPPSLPPQSRMKNTCGHSALTKNQNYGSSFTPRPTLLYGPQAVDGSAQRPRSGGVRGPQSQSEKIASWHAEKATLGTPDQKPSERESILYRLADTCTSLMHDNGGRIGDVARSLGGFLVTPPVDPQHIRRYFGDLKGFPQIDELLTIVSGGVPVIAPPSRADLNAALQYGNHRSAQAHLPLIWKKIGEDVRRERCLVINKAAAHDIPNLRVMPLGAVVTPKKVRIISDLSFEPENRGVKGGLNADTDVDSVPPSLCAEALPEFLTELVSLRAANPKRRILMATTDVNDAYRNVRVDPDQAHNFCYAVDDLIAIDFRLTFGWTGSPGNFGVMASAARHAHNNTNLDNVQLLPEGTKMMEHVKIVDGRWATLHRSLPIPRRAKAGGGNSRAPSRLKCT